MERPDNTHVPATEHFGQAPILVVLESNRERSIVDEILRSLGFTNILLADSTKVAIKILDKEDVNLLVCGVDFADLDGWRLARLVRSGVLHVDSELPIIMLSDTWCERIAEVTAREFAIDYLLPVGKLDRLIVLTCLARQSSHHCKPSLLVVEDSRDTADLVCRILNQSFDVEIQQEGVGGLSSWLEKKHDLVLLDLMLPNLSGRDILAKITEVAPEQPVVMMTANSDASLAEELMFMGAADFIPKPFRPAQLRNVCNLALRREDFIISNEQFSTQVKSLAERERAYREVNEKHQQLLYNLQTTVLQLNSHLQIEFINYSWEKLMGYSIEESLGIQFVDFLASQDEQSKNKLAQDLNAILSLNDDSKEFGLCLLNRWQERVWVDVKVNLARSGGGTTSLVMCLDDITARKQAQEKLEYLAGHDSLTGLLNRHEFDESLTSLDKDASLRQVHHGLIYLDLDHFKVINDTFGHHQGDEVLKEVSRLIKQTVSSTDILCRLGGDEFAILVKDVTEEQLVVVANRVQNAVGEYSFKAENHRTNLGCCIGISLIDGKARKSEEYLMQADIALYVAKGRGRNLIHVYSVDDDESENLKTRIDWSAKVKSAVEEDRLVMHFQPVQNIARGEIKYYEALVRLIDVNGEIIYPDSFIPHMESSGEVHLLDKHIIKLAITTLRKFPELGKIAINLSAQAFRDENLVPTIKESLYLTGVDASRIVFELTESASLFNLNITRRVINELHALGCHFSIDDFGSGFSSFAYLKELPADYIKLDGSFIKRLDQDATDQALVKSIIEVVQALGKRTVAEYVENKRVYMLLKEFGIDYVQGYFIGRPMAAEEIVRSSPHKLRSVS